MILCRKHTTASYPEIGQAASAHRAQAVGPPATRHPHPRHFLIVPNGGMYAVSGSISTAGGVISRVRTQQSGGSTDQRESSGIL